MLDDLMFMWRIDCFVASLHPVSGPYSVGVPALHSLIVYKFGVVSKTFGKICKYNVEADIYYSFYRNLKVSLRFSIIYSTPKLCTSP